MNKYIENPKTKGSGIICAIPQTGTCPIGCSDCFFQAGRSYLEPLADNLPNVPTRDQCKERVVRINDGNDSNVDRALVLECAKRYDRHFFNTSIPKLDFPGPVVLTVNPGKLTDWNFHRVSNCPPNLMFVRFRTNTWNLDLCADAVEFYTKQNVPVVLTFMAFYDDEIKEGHSQNYSLRKRTLNSYNVITPEAWDLTMSKFSSNNLVYSCGKDANTFSCARCGNCMREYYVACERLKSTP